MLPYRDGRQAPAGSGVTEWLGGEGVATNAVGPSRTHLLNPASIGQANRARVLEYLHREGPSSRATIARDLHVSRATIATILQPLLDNGTLIEQEPGRASAAGGKPPRPLWFADNGRLLGAMRIAPTHITGALLGLDGSVRRTHQVPVPCQIGAPASRERYDSAILEVAHRCFDDATLLGVGVAASGMIDTDRGVIIRLHLAPALEGYPAAERLGSEFDCEVAVDHHPRVQALGDRWFGQGRHLSHFASVYTGEALGFGIVHEGRIIRGEAGAGGESGHTVVDLNGAQCACGRRGCWETVATLGWLRQEAVRRQVPGAASIDCGELAALADTGLSEAVELLDTYARNLAIGMANNEHVFASGTYIMHGDVCAGGDLMQARLSHWMAAFSPDRREAPHIVMGDAKDDITLLGGGGMVLSAVLGSL